MTAPLLDSPVSDAPPDGLDTHASATRMASIIAAGVAGREPTLAPGGAAAPPEPAPGAAPVIPSAPAAATPAPAAVAEPVVPAPAVAAPEPEAFSDEQFLEVEKVLSELGVDLGVDRAGLPPEMLPAYSRLVQSAVDMSQRELSERLAASEAQRQVTELGERLEKEPEKLLLAVAISKPDVFEKVIQIFQAMQQDPQHRDLVLRELETDARSRELARREASYTERDIVTQARQVTTATKIACRKANVPFEMGEKVVALAIKANGGRLEPSEVDGIIGDLKGFIIQPAAPKPVAAVAKVATVGAAPAAPVAGSAAPAVVTEPVLPRVGGGSVFRNLIRDANAKIGAALRSQ